MAGKDNELTGMRRITVWDEPVWVHVLHASDKGRYRVIPEEGDEFEVTASDAGELDDVITRELRRRRD